MRTTLNSKPSGKGIDYLRRTDRCPGFSTYVDLTNLMNYEILNKQRKNKKGCHCWRQILRLMAVPESFPSIWIIRVRYVLKKRISVVICLAQHKAQFEKWCRHIEFGQFSDFQKKYSKLLFSLSLSQTRTHFLVQFCQISSI